MPVARTAQIRRRVYNLRPMLPEKHGQRRSYRRKPSTETKASESRKKMAKRNRKHEYTTEDKMIQTSGTEELVKGHRNDGQQCSMDLNLEDESGMRSLSPMPNFSEIDISSLLGILSPVNEHNTTHSVQGQHLMASDTSPSPSQCPRQRHYMPCSCRHRAVSWCPAHACLYPDVQSAGCRQAAAMYPQALCAAGCLCAGLCPPQACPPQASQGPGA